MTSTFLVVSARKKPPVHVCETVLRNRQSFLELNHNKITLLSVVSLDEKTPIVYQYFERAACLCFPSSKRPVKYELPQELELIMRLKLC